MKEIGKQRVRIKDLYSYFFLCPIIEMDYVGMAKQEVESNPSIEESLYYQDLSKKLQAYGTVFHTIKDDEGIRERTKVWKKMIADMKESYVDTDGFRILENGLPYGSITAILRKNKIFVVDGHHRIAILHSLGYEEVDLILFLENDMEEFWYQDRYPVETKMHIVNYNWSYKRILDLGCNIGMLGNYVINQDAERYIGIDLNPKYITEAKRRNPELEFYIMDALEAVKKYKNDIDTLVALGLFHHLPDDTVIEILNQWKGDLIFEVPTGNKPYHEYTVRTCQWYKDLLKNYSKIVIVDSGMNLDPTYPFDRKMFVCEK